jgi:glutathione synthase/RimK-type ligase-like ATP-grasp enzyme
MARSTVVILATPDDAHAIAVAQAIDASYPGHKVFIVDSGEFPSKLTLAIREDHWTLDTANGRICSSDVSALWHRRPRTPIPDEAIKDAAMRRFAVQESGLAFDFLSLSTDYRVINRIENHFAANRKPYQLHVARSCGLRVPEYNITNDPRHIAELLAEHGENAFIFKPLGPPVHTIAETRYLNESHRQAADHTKLAPVIFQRAIQRKREIRLTFIGGRIFCHQMIIHNERVKSLPDWRLDLAAESQETQLPDDLLGKVRTMMLKLGLLYGAIDFIENDAGEFYFLEVNPQGQFLFSEIDAHTPLCNAFAELLVRPLS